MSLLLSAIGECVEHLRAGPLAVGYSGGKDSTALLDVVLRASESIGWSQKVVVIRTFVYVEDGDMESFAVRQLDAIGSLPNVVVEQAKAKANQAFFANVCGRGYWLPSEAHNVHWCRRRLKDAPFQKACRKHKTVYTALGMRRSESVARARSMRTKRNREEMVTPIRNWRLSDVWGHIQGGVMWNANMHEELRHIYRGRPRDGCWCCTKTANQDLSTSRGELTRWLRGISNEPRRYSAILEGGSLRLTLRVRRMILDRLVAIGHVFVPGEREFIDEMLAKAELAFD